MCREGIRGQRDLLFQMSNESIRWKGSKKKPWGELGQHHGSICDLPEACSVLDSFSRALKTKRELESCYNLLSTEQWNAPTISGFSQWRALPALLHDLFMQLSPESSQLTIFQLLLACPDWEVSCVGLAFSERLACKHSLICKIAIFTATMFGSAHTRW